jgi:hypothetical protein
MVISNDMSTRSVAIKPTTSEPLQTAQVIPDTISAGAAVPVVGGDVYLDPALAAAVAPVRTGLLPLLPERMTFSELVDGLNGIKAGEGTSPAAVLNRYKALVVAMEKLPVYGTAFESYYTKARKNAETELGLPHSKEKVHPAGNLPLEPSPIPFRFDLEGLKSPFGTNAQLSASLAAIAYENPQYRGDSNDQVGPHHDHMVAQGFKNPIWIEGVTETNPNGASLPLPGGMVMTLGTRPAKPGVPSLLAIALRGTDNNEDKMADLKLDTVDGTKRYGAGKVHKGFDQWLESVWRELSEAIKAARKKDPNGTILFTGHSLGGAGAVLALARAKHEGLLDNPPYRGTGSVAVLDTFGQPKVGDEVFAQHFAKVLGDVPYHKYVYRNDPVARLPPQNLDLLFTNGTYADIPSANIYIMEADGSTPQVARDSPRMLETLNQDVHYGKVVTTAKQAAPQVVDHSQLNYLIGMNRMAQDGKL